MLTLCSFSPQLTGKKKRSKENLLLHHMGKCFIHGQNLIEQVPKRPQIPPAGAIYNDKNNLSL